MMKMMVRVVITIVMVHMKTEGGRGDVLHQGNVLLVVARRRWRRLFHLWKRFVFIIFVHLSITYQCDINPRCSICAIFYPITFQKEERAYAMVIFVVSLTCQPLSTTSHSQVKTKKVIPRSVMPVPPLNDLDAYLEFYRPPEWLLNVEPRKFPYFPQIMDEVRLPLCLLECEYFVILWGVGHMPPLKFTSRKLLRLLL